MGEQQSQKRGLRSSSQKEDSARDPYAPVPPSNPVGGAFGGSSDTRQSDEELSFRFEERPAKESRTKQGKEDGA